MSIFSKLFSDPNQKVLNELDQLVQQINALEPEYEALSDDVLAAQTDKFKRQLEQGKSLDDIMPKAFAVVREVSKRVTGMRHFDVQIMGGIVLHKGQIAEMKTGEGKTLTSTLPIYLNALTGKGVHVVTVNDYLAARDAVWMGQIFDFLGLSVSCIQNQTISHIYDKTIVANEDEKDETRDEEGNYKIVHDYLRECTRQEAYKADITYGTNNEFGFDYLRDNMAQKPEELVQRKLSYAIIDEVDSILIDEARTPLIISAPAEESTNMYRQFSELVKRLQENIDYNIDEKMRSATLTEVGIKKMEQALGVDNIYVSGGIRMVHHLEQALKANTLFKLDKDYVVKDGEIIIVDEFTGRLMPGRRYSEGLHQAIEAKENVEVQRESQTLATITFQNYFRIYDKLSGMTGTAVTEAEEFSNIYKLDVVVIPTNNPLIRDDRTDKIYKNEYGKFAAVVQDVKEKFDQGQPVLIGTVSIEKNELLADLLKKAGVPCNILNAKQHEKEAEFIAQAGKTNAVTVATNMAGRGVDIVLGGNPSDPQESKKVKELNGLHVIGTERHESRRIDNQLRGRAGRQGDPGSTQFYISMDDDVMRIFGSEKMKAVMDRLRLPDDMPIENKFISRSIESAQKKVEGHNFDARKHVLEYDDVLNKHRTAIYGKRQVVLFSNNNKDLILEMINNELEQVISFHTSGEALDQWNIKEILEVASTIYPISNEQVLLLKYEMK
jgi:preprotein translocase subunit SecA